MSETENSNATTSSEASEATTTEVSAETQSVDSQPTGQADTTPETTEVNQSMGITPKEESENSESGHKSIHELVEAHINGELSEEDQKLIEENGLKDYLNDLAEVRQMRIERNDKEVISVVGSPEAYKELQEWGTNNLSAEEQQAFNDALFSGNMNLAKLAVQGLKARYENENGKAPDRVIEAGGTANQANRPYSNVQEYIQETQTFQYKQDPEFRAKVESRRNKSGF